MVQERWRAIAPRAQGTSSTTQPYESLFIYLFILFDPYSILIIPYLTHRDQDGPRSGGGGQARGRGCQGGGGGGEGAGEEADGQEEDQAQRLEAEGGRPWLLGSGRWAALLLKK